MALAVGAAGGYLFQQQRVDDCAIAVQEYNDWQGILYRGLETQSKDDDPGAQVLEFGQVLEDMDNITDKWRDEYDADDVQELGERCTGDD
ncbi:hypothetical protein ASD30_25655 [Nocardioides sp. Root140]|nr:hypothetical protein ASD30_25655 [Nocardioides sp. Root140]